MHSDRIFDDLLVGRYISGDRGALDLLIKRWEQKVFRQLVRVTGDALASQDISQEVWVAVIKGLSRLRDRSSFGAWAMRIATLKGYDWIREQQKERRRSEEIKRIDDSEDDNMAEDQLERLITAVSQLPSNQKNILQLFYLDKHNVHEISSILNIPRGTVKSRLFHAREKLKKILNQTS
ncbi:MAG: sigma-70 family RNA polymerase sigma factor [Cyclobacteriaceae bacterium]